MTVLSDILRDIHAKASVYFCDELVPPWCLEMKDLNYASFHQVRRGQCLIECGDISEIAGPGDIIFIPRHADHTLKSVDSRGEEFKTLLLCGYFQFDQALDHPLLTTLPTLIIIRSDLLEKSSGLKHTLDFLTEEFTSHQPGSNLLLDKLTEIMLIQLIRTEFSTENISNFSKALFDNQISQALKHLHSNPAHRWTLDSLSKKLAFHALRWQIVSRN